MSNELAAEVGLRVIHRATRVAGNIARVLPDGVAVTTPTGERLFRFYPSGFIANGQVVTLIAARPKAGPDLSVKITASGSVEDPGAGFARTARASRLWVEGIHDAQLVERVWGDDLRSLGIVVERTDGIDTLEDRIVAFAPKDDRRLGMLVDHLVEGSKEQRIAERIEDRWSPNVLVRGTPYVDIWQAVRPAVIGIDAWPGVPRNEDWKTGVCKRLGAPDPQSLWRFILSKVTSYKNLETPLVSAVEELLDMLTE